MSDLTSPVSSAKRIPSLDIIRGIAVLGIFTMNINGFGLPSAYEDPTGYGGSEGWNRYAWLMNEMVFNGTMRGLFTMLFGAGVVLLTGRLEAKGAGIGTADVYYRRNIWLLIIGIIHAYLLLGPGDILYAYAVFGFMLFPFRKSQPWKLVMAGAFLLLIGTGIYAKEYFDISELKQRARIAETSAEAGRALSEAEVEALENWKDAQRKPSEEDILQEIQVHRDGGYLENVKAYSSLVKYMQTEQVYEAWIWDLLPMMLIGMAFFRWGIFQGERSLKFYFLLMLGGYVIGYPLNYYESMLEIRNNWEAMAHHQALITKHIGRVTVTFGHIGLFMLFIKSGWLRRLQLAFSSAGKMALTNYLMQSVISGFLFLGYGFSLYGQLERYQLYYVVIAVWVFQLVSSPIWMYYFRFGPAEWLWRCLTYQKIQPLRRSAKPGV